MICLKNVDIYTPDLLKNVNIWIAGSQIIEINNLRQPDSNLDEVIDCTDLIAVPGLVDIHVHLIGGGGEAGMASRTPELMVSKALVNGITSVAGLLGTDTVTRSLEALLAKARGLAEEGITAKIYTGGYAFPSPTLTNSIQKDLFLVPEVCGLKIAFADHRSSYPSIGEIERMISIIRVAGMLRNHIMQVHFHIGDDYQDINLLIELVERRPYLAPHMTITHVNRTKKVFEMALKAASVGINIDLSSGLNRNTLYEDTLSVSEAINRYLAEGLPISQLTVSSDGNGSAARYNPDGTVSEMSVSDIGTLFNAFRESVLDKVTTNENLVEIFMVNTGKRIGLAKKAPLDSGKDADIILLSKKDYSIHSVFALGKSVIKEGKLMHRGFFE